jgi:hypothetical protein
MPAQADIGEGAYGEGDRRVLASLPQAAILVGAACGAMVSYNGHRLFAFAPVKACADLPRC